jgi:beta-1,2-rhamnosyltransferase WsaF-like protein
VRSLRAKIKRMTPQFGRKAYAELRRLVEPPPPEAIVLHPYAIRRDDDKSLRLSLVLPSLSPERRFGGVATAIDLFLECGKRAKAELRFLLDDFDQSIDREHVERRARAVGVEPSSISYCRRSDHAQPIELRANDIFMAYNWWALLNLKPLVGAQERMFDAQRRPLLYLIQEYEPGFYPFSSTHLYARAAFEQRAGVWAIFNSSQLLSFCHVQGHAFEREYVFEPRLTPAMRPFLDQEPAPKNKQILVYGRPSIPRNCFPAAIAGLRAWTERYPEFRDWEVWSVGMEHRSLPIAGARKLRSLGKLSIEDYAEQLRKTAIGISLMASPHPSYPPLEMAHFGVKTLTNGYLCKDLGAAHDNIVSLPDIAPDAIAEALAKACLEFEKAPASGWQGRSHMPGYLDQRAYPFLDRLALDIRETASATTSAPKRN